MNKKIKLLVTTLIGLPNLAFAATSMDIQEKGGTTLESYSKNQENIKPFILDNPAHRDKLNVYAGHSSHRSHASHSSHRSHYSSSGGGGYSSSSTYSPSYSSTYPSQSNNLNNYTVSTTEKASSFTNNYSSIVAKVQVALMNKGYYSGDVDGIISDSTRESIKKLQKENQIEETGKIDINTLKLLNIEIK